MQSLFETPGRFISANACRAICRVLKLLAALGFALAPASQAAIDFTYNSANDIPRLSAGLRPSIVTSQIAPCASVPIIVRGEGHHIYDARGKKYIVCCDTGRRSARSG